MAFEWWMVAAGANVVMVVLYAAIAVLILYGIYRGHQWRTNPIALATAAVFVSCTIGHGHHLLHVVPSALTGETAEAVAAGRAMFSDWRLILWDGFTASVAIWYWAMRSRLAIIYSGASLCEDMVERQRHAAVLHENVVAGLSRAWTAIDEGRREEGTKEVAATLEASKNIITTLIGGSSKRSRLAAGDLRREEASH